MRHRTIAPFIILAALAIVCVTLTACAFAEGEFTVTATESDAAEVCFPRADWSTAYGASAEDRPCYTISRPQEDTSGRLLLGTLGADAATCVIPNVFEERGHFAIHCHRLPDRGNR
jgi:hypothetical protein